MSDRDVLRLDHGFIIRAKKNPAATALVFQFVFPRPVTFPAAFAGSTARAATAATDTAAFTLRRNGWQAMQSMRRLRSVAPA